MKDKMEFIAEESKRLGESVQLSREVADFFLDSTVGFPDGVALATMATIVVKYCELRGFRTEDFVQDLTHTVDLMTKYRF